MHLSSTAMPYEDDEDPKKPHAVEPPHKRDGDREAQEHEPHEVMPGRRLDNRRHVRC